MALCHRASLYRTHKLNWEGSKKAVMVVRNSMAYLQALWKKTPVARAVVALPVPKQPEEGQLQEGVDEPQGHHTPRLTVKQRHGKLFDELDLNGLDSWDPELVDAACWLWAKYHEVFSLDPAELGCTYSMEHTIKLMDDTSFKERFRQIPLSLVQEVWNHLQEMLESGAIQPSHSAWCNAVVLVRKKDGGLWFCIDFCHLIPCMKKDSYPLPRIQVALDLGGGVSNHDRCPLLWSDKPTWKVTSPPPKPTSSCCISDQHSLVYGQPSYMGQVYQPHPMQDYLWKRWKEEDATRGKW